MSDQMEILPEEFREWVEHKITREVTKQVVVLRDQLKDYLAAGNTVHKDAELTTDRVVGRIEGVTELFNMFQEAKEATKEEKPEYGY